MKKLMRTVMPVFLSSIVLAGSGTAIALPGKAGDGFRYNADGSVNCIENGWKYIPDQNDPYAPAPHCFYTDAEDVNALQPIATEIQEYESPEAARAALERIEETSPINPQQNLAGDTFAYQKLSGEEPISPYSHEISRSTMETNIGKGNRWSTGVNIGWGKEAKESIPIYTVDSSNPEQHFITVTSRDSRVTSNETSKKMMLGKIPFPEWGKLRMNDSGDRSIAIYDVATGVWRSMFMFVPDSQATDGNTYHFSSGGYIQAKPNFEGFGEDNYWMSLMTSTSSVVGLSNELTQIGVEEVRAGEINHMVSMTWQDYQRISGFPTKMTDGRVSKDDYPHAPHAGQMFTLPADFDIDYHVKERGGGEFMKTYLRAVQEYGAIITDRNAVINAVNFEHPAGYAKYARHQQNVYLEDPEIVEALRGFDVHTFPYMDLEWIELDYAGHALNTGANAQEKETRDRFVPHAPEKHTLSSDVYTSLYKGEHGYENPIYSHFYMNGNNTNHMLFFDPTEDEVKWQSSGTTEAGSFSTAAPGVTFKPADDFVGKTEYGLLAGWSFNGGTFDNNGRIWHVNVVEKDQPNARTDRVELNPGKTETITPLSNDDTAHGQGNSGFADLSLVDEEGNETKNLTIDGAEFNVNPDNTVTITTDRDSNGFLNHVKYIATTEDGKTGEGHVLVTVTQSGEPVMTDAEYYTPSYEETSVIQGEQTTVSPSLTEEDAFPEGTVFSLPVDSPEWISIDENTGEITLNPTEDVEPVSSENITINITYPDGSIDEVELSYTIEELVKEPEEPVEPPLNTVYDPSYPSTVTVENGTTYEIEAPLNSDGSALPDDVVFTKGENFPHSILELREDGTLLAQPDTENLEGHSVDVRITYSDGTFHDLSFKLVVENPEEPLMNTQYTPVPTTVSLKEGDTLQAEIEEENGKSFPEGTRYLLSENALSWVEVDEDGKLHLSPGAEHVGTHEIPVSVVYADNSYNSTVLTVNVEAKTLAEKFAPYYNNTEVKAGETTQSTVQDGAENSTYTLLNAPEWVSMDAETGLLTVSPERSVDTGEYSLSVQVEYNDGSSEEITTVISVSEADPLMSEVYAPFYEMTTITENTEKTTSVRLQESLGKELPAGTTVSYDSEGYDWLSLDGTTFNIAPEDESLIGVYEIPVEVRFPDDSVLIVELSIDIQALPSEVDEEDNNDTESPGDGDENETPGEDEDNNNTESPGDENGNEDNTESPGEDNNTETPGDNGGTDSPDENNDNNGDTDSGLEDGESNDSDTENNNDQDSNLIVNDDERNTDSSPSNSDNGNWTAVERDNKSSEGSSSEGARSDTGGEAGETGKAGLLGAFALLSGLVAWFTTRRISKRKEQ